MDANSFSIVLMSASLASFAVMIGLLVGSLSLGLISDLREWWSGK